MTMDVPNPDDISTHTLRGERDITDEKTAVLNGLFQLTRSVGSVTI